MHWFWYVLLVLILMGGFLLNAMTYPGIWVMIAAAAGYVQLTHGQYMSWSMWMFLAVLGLAAEVAESVAGSAGIKRGGATKRGKWGAFLGGLLGGIFLTFLVPIFIIGTIVGICVGSFLGVLVAELGGGRQTHHAARAGAGAAVGRLLGLFTKMIFATVILLIGIFMAFPHHLPPGKAPPPTLPLRPPSER